MGLCIKERKEKKRRKKGERPGKDLSQEPSALQLRDSEQQHSTSSWQAQPVSGHIEVIIALLWIPARNRYATCIIQQGNAAIILACRLMLCCFSIKKKTTSLPVSWLKPCSTAAMGSLQSGVAPELNRIQLSTICRCGQSSKVINL